ncbi:MAG: HAMP domain-containing histidine kinase [Aquisalinus sp.]|nr:HAMP domain-containing histidine kinase [Aquisalinus sp.]
MNSNVLNKFWEKTRSHRQPLPVQLLLMTVLFVILAEVLLFIPSVAKFRYDWLSERIERAYLTSLAFEVAPENMVDDQTVRQLYATAEILGVRLEVDGRSQLVLGPDMMRKPGLEYRQIDLRNPNYFSFTRDALYNIFSSDNAYLLVMGTPDAAPDVAIELFLEKAPLQRALWTYSAGILALSIFIAMFVAAGIYISIMRSFMRPMIRITQNMAAFQEQPEDASRLMVPSGRQDEIGDAEKVLASMQMEIRSALSQKTRLAALGEGVSKINHDLRNVLASAVLMSDRLAKSDDPRVQKLSPRLIQALNRAVALCRATLDYGQADIKEVSIVNLFDLVEETSEGLKQFTEEDVAVAFVNDVSPDCDVQGDRMQLFRAVFNLARNAAEVMSSIETDKPKITFSSREESGKIILDVRDNGPGVPEEAQANLFVPFKGSKRQGGTGLGLAIASEAVKAHGGELRLAATGVNGTTFRIILPER